MTAKIVSTKELSTPIGNHKQQKIRRNNNEFLLIQTIKVKLNNKNYKASYNKMPFICFALSNNDFSLLEKCSSLTISFRRRKNNMLNKHERNVVTIFNNALLKLGRGEKSLLTEKYSVQATTENVVANNEETNRSSQCFSVNAFDLVATKLNTAITNNLIPENLKVDFTSQYTEGIDLIEFASNKSSYVSAIAGASNSNNTTLFVENNTSSNMNSLDVLKGYKRSLRALQSNTSSFNMINGNAGSLIVLKDNKKSHNVLSKTGDSVVCNSSLYAKLHVSFLSTKNTFVKYLELLHIYDNIIAQDNVVVNNIFTTLYQNLSNKTIAIFKNTMALSNSYLSNNYIKRENILLIMGKNILHSLVVKGDTIFRGGVNNKYHSKKYLHMYFMFNHIKNKSSCFSNPLRYQYIVCVQTIN